MTTERAVSVVLRAGVLLSAVVAGVGGLWYLSAHGSQPASFTTPTPPQPLGPSERVIALGVLVLILTPVVRVALLTMAFARQREPIYVVLSALVLAVLVVSLA
jgi:uncharacterized membrane protein